MASILFLWAAWAGIAQGSSYPTFDLDVAYARDELNLERLARALEELRVSLRVKGEAADLPFIPDARSLANGANFTFMTEFGMFDVLGDLAGVSSMRICVATLRRQGGRRVSDPGGLD